LPEDRNISKHGASSPNRTGEAGGFVRTARSLAAATAARLGAEVRTFFEERSRRRLGLGLAAAAAAGWALGASAVGTSLQADLRSLDLDPDRAGLLTAWIGCVAVAALAGALTGRPWPAALGATGFVAAAYAAPWAWATTAAPPVLFGSPERLDPWALAGRLVAIVGVGFVAAVPFAAGGHVVGEAVAATARGVRHLTPRSSAAALLTLVLAAGAAAAGAAPLVRYGPANGLFEPAATGTMTSGEVLSRSFPSAAMQQRRAYAVYLPPGYRAHPKARYPVLYLLHGDPGSYRDWIALGIARTLDAGVATGSLPAMIAVMPDGNGSANVASQWADAWDGRDRVEDSVLELVALVDHTYRTLPDRRHRVIAGLSEGGFGAANLAARHPGVFGVSISLSGYFAAQGPVFGRDPAYIRANSPSQILQGGGPARTVRYFLAAGTQDPRYRRAAQAFALELERLGVRHELFTLPGGHDGQVWTAGLVVSLEQLRSQLGSSSP